jgi:hypothetical protein
MKSFYKEKCLSQDFQTREQNDVVYCIHLCDTLKKRMYTVAYFLGRDRHFISSFLIHIISLIDITSSLFF